MADNYLMIYDEDDLKSKIYIIRGVQVMLDFDLAKIYGYSTMRFNEQVKNNIERFDYDFRFQLTDFEFKNLISKFSISRWGGTYHDRYIFIDSGTKNEIIYHCGGSSKDGGKRVTSITKVEDVMLYQNIIDNLRNNTILRL